MVFVLGFGVEYVLQFPISDLRIPTGNIALLQNLNLHIHQFLPISLPHPLLSLSKVSPIITTTTAIVSHPRPRAISRTSSSLEIGYESCH